MDIKLPVDPERLAERQLTSNMHALLVPLASGFHMADISTHGTKINGVLIQSFKDKHIMGGNPSGKELVMIKEGDIISFGIDTSNGNANYQGCEFQVMAGNGTCGSGKRTNKRKSKNAKRNLDELGDDEENEVDQPDNANAKKKGRKSESATGQGSTALDRRAQAVASGSAKRFATVQRTIAKHQHRSNRPTGQSAHMYNKRHVKAILSKKGTTKFVVTLDMGRGRGDKGRGKGWHKGCRGGKVGDGSGGGGRA